MNFGDTADEKGSFEQLDAFAEAGGTLIDTADVYGAGLSESIVGRWLAARPTEVTENVVLATKGRFPNADEVGRPNGVGLSRRHLERALDASLRRLGVETIDLYQVHAWDPLTPLAETLAFLDHAVRAGKIRYYGLSNFTGWQTTKAVALAAANGLVPPVTMQPQYNLLAREVEWEIGPACADAGIGLLPWSPLAGGVLAGRYRKGVAPETGSRLADSWTAPFYGPRLQDKRTWDVLEAVEAIAETHKISHAQVAVAWLLARPGVSSVILGARTLGQLEDNLAAADMILAPEETARLNEVSTAEIDYPYSARDLQIRSRTADGAFAVAEA